MSFARHPSALLLSFAVHAAGRLPAAPPDPSTFSIAAADPATGEVGVAVASRFFAVGTVVPWARAGVGAVATQAFVNPLYGVDGLAALAAGKVPEAIVAELTARDEGRDQRQMHLIDAKGRKVAQS